MRINLPVTNNEYELKDGFSIVSETNVKGLIKYANPYFIEVSGFSEAELIGSPQNILRHPDMPVEAFADMWDTIKSGIPWTAMVNNMTLTQSLILAAIEGLTEFLPVSSTGHMILASAVMKMQDNEFVKSFEIAIQLGAVLSIVLIYAKQFLKGINLHLKLLTAFLPTAVIDFLGLSHHQDLSVQSDRGGGFADRWRDSPDHG